MNEMKWYSIVGLAIAIVSMFVGFIVAEKFGRSELLANIVLVCQLGWLTPFVEFMNDGKQTI